MSELEKEMLKFQLEQTQKLLYDTLFRLDQIKMKVTGNEKVSKKEILNIIDGEKDGNYC